MYLIDHKCIYTYIVDTSPNTDINTKTVIKNFFLIISND